MEKHHLILFISKEASSQKKYSLNLLFPEIIVYNIKYITKKKQTLKNYVYALQGNYKNCKSTLKLFLTTLVSATTKNYAE